MIPLALLLLAVNDPLALNDVERARLDRGEVLVTSVPVAGSPVPAACARAVIDAPPEKVWPVVWNCARYTQTMPSIATSELVERTATSTLCRVVVDLPFPLPDLMSLSRAELTVEPGVRWRREWKMVEGDYDVNQGSFTLLPWGDGKTLAIYRVEARPKMPLPDWLLAKAQGDRLPEMMERIRKEARTP